MRPTVVKVGGSFARYSRLRDVVAALAIGAGRTVVVPGGGPFADCVRREQPKIGFDDAAAHRMALLAMAAFGTALTSLSPILKPAPRVAAIKRILADGDMPVWLPLDLLESRTEVSESWDMTSDSLAAWLAGRLGAERLILLKREMPASLAVSDLVAAGLLDPLMPRFLASAKVEAWICGPRHLAGIGKALADGSEIGRRIEVA